MTYDKKDILPLRDELCEKYKGQYKIIYAEDGDSYIVQKSYKIFWLIIRDKLNYGTFDTIKEAEEYIDKIIRYNEIELPEIEKKKKNAGKIVKYYP